MLGPPTAAVNFDGPFRPFFSSRKMTRTGEATARGDRVDSWSKEPHMTTITTSMTPEMGALKARLKTTWESGDYAVFAKYLEPGALAFFDRLNIPAGTRLLDIA